MKLYTNIFIGRSGCGKGTQVDKLTDFFKEKKLGEIFYLEAGQRFRNFYKENTYTSHLAKKVGEGGGLQPPFLSVWAWASELTNKFESNQHLFIDGTPRRMIEADLLESAFKFYNIDQVNVIYINVSDEWSIDRMTGRGRVDDSVEAIKKRLAWFDKDVEPILEHYRNHSQHNFIEINGEQPIDKVHADIVKALDL